MLEIKLFNDGMFCIDEDDVISFSVIPDCYNKDNNRTGEGYGLQLNNHSIEKEIKDLCFEIHELVRMLGVLVKCLR